MTKEQRAETEIEEFSAKFPETDLDDVPESVWESVKNGTALCAAYEEFAESSKKRTEEAARVNEENAAKSSGYVGGEPKKAIYTAKEVSAMSEKQIKDNYDDILYSMGEKGFFD